jgi:prepilin-type N-terminal cleavage/methylation domain-containing protein
VQEPLEAQGTVAQMSIHKHTGVGCAGATRLRRDGFSLLELLAVMSIMALLSTLAVTSYFGAVRGMSIRSAKRHFENALVQARQRACIDGARVSLIAFNEIASYESDGITVKDMAACFVVCKEIGRISFVSGTYLFDEYADLKQLFGVDTSGSAGTGSLKSEGGVRLYNLTEGTWTMVRPFVKEQDVGGSNAKLLYSGGTHTFKSYAFQMQSGVGSQSTGAGSWKVGDSYGVEVSPVQSLPKGFSFSDLNSSDVLAVKHVTFEPDGTTLNAENFRIEAAKSAGGGNITFSVSTQGKISY